MSRRARRSFATGLGAAVRLVDRGCTALYIAGTCAMAGLLFWYAFTKTAWLLLLAVPTAATAALMALAFHRNPGLGLRLEWPVRRPRARAGSRASGKRAPGRFEE